ncbi:hypothetical protein BCY84_06814 [Trypanosoma cruzi cruzi]|nr:hypothetical protein BCY84_06814 [Trypanosoma cruzi cruzi]
MIPHARTRFWPLQTEESCMFKSNAISRHIACLERSGGFLYGRICWRAAGWTCGSILRKWSWKILPHRLCWTR